MIGAIAGDVIGSVFEMCGLKSENFLLFSERSTFTDDTVLTLAVADSIMGGEEIVSKLKEYHAFYPQAGYGRSFG